nr:hypothetical protein BgiMline_034959 [Biomphalaria glabrata]KAI8750184.1 hypothetical protein BgiMline_017134 [Biomphalaria glabrata]
MFVTQWSWLVYSPECSLHSGRGSSIAQNVRYTVVMARLEPRMFVTQWSWLSRAQIVRYTVVVARLEPRMFVTQWSWFVYSPECSLHSGRGSSRAQNVRYTVVVVRL